MDTMAELYSWLETADVGESLESYETNVILSIEVVNMVGGRYLKLEGGIIVGLTNSAEEAIRFLLN